MDLYVGRGFLSVVCGASAQIHYQSDCSSYVRQCRKFGAAGMRGKQVVVRESEDAIFLGLGCALSWTIKR